MTLTEPLQAFDDKQAEIVFLRKKRSIWNRFSKTRDFDLIRVFIVYTEL